jgi:hypothetical protein
MLCIRAAKLESKTAGAADIRERSPPHRNERRATTRANGDPTSTSFPEPGRHMSAAPESAKRLRK